MTLTPEELLVEMTALWGEEAATTVWLFLDQRLAGRRLYWPQRAGRLHRERCIYEAVARRGRRPPGMNEKGNSTNMIGWCMQRRRWAGQPRCRSI